jgi:arginine decarboxylase
MPTPRDRADQSRAPLLEALIRVAAADVWPFHTPGHKRGRALDDSLREALGAAAALDLTELIGLDDLALPRTVIADALKLAAQAFGARRTWFSVNGSSAGVAAMVAAAAGPGDSIVMPRNVHRSVVAGLVAGGARPVFVAPPLDPVLGVPGPVTWAELEETLSGQAAWSGAGAIADRGALEDRRALEDRGGSPTARPRAVLLVSPTYEGRTADVAGIGARLAAAAPAGGRPLLLVDEAHGPHFSFGGDGFPPSALAQGADAVVHSLHKAGGSLTQSALLHTGPRCPDWFDPGRWLALAQTSSPSYLLMASLDGARRRLATRGREDLARARSLADRLRRDLGDVRGLLVDDPGGETGDPAGKLTGHVTTDPTRICLRVAGGHRAAARFAADLRARGVVPEMVAGDLVIMILTAADDENSARALLDACRAACRAGGEDGTGGWPATARFPFDRHLPRQAMTPRQAFSAPWEKIALGSALGRVAAQTVAPSPPGTILLVPGEVVDEDTLAGAAAAAREGLGVPMEIEVTCLR